MGVPVTVAMGNAYYVFFVPMVIAMRMPMPTVMGMPMTMCTGTYTIGKHASRGGGWPIHLVRVVMKFLGNLIGRKQPTSWASQ